MKNIYFDSSTLISMALACILQQFAKLRADFAGQFCITPTVKSETIDRALTTLKFKYEGIRLQNLLRNKILTLKSEQIYARDIKELLELANSTFFAWGKAVKIVHPGEISALTVALREGADVYAVDERTTRLLIESPKEVADLLSSKLHTPIEIDKQNLHELKSELSALPVIRSSELAIAAFEKGYFGRKERELLEAILWALKFAGCAITRAEIESYLNELT